MFGIEKFIMIGVVEKSSDIAGHEDEVDSINLADFDVGLTWVWKKTSTSLVYGSALGQATDSNGEHYLSLKNYRLNANITYRPKSNNSLSLIAVKTVDGESGDLFDDDQFFVQYRYEWATGL